MPQASSKKREKQYEHIESSLEDRGRSAKTAKQIAARTVNKERARAGEAAQASRTSTHDISSSRRGGLRSHSGSQGHRKSSCTKRPRRRTSRAVPRCPRPSSRRQSAAEAPIGARSRRPAGRGRSFVMVRASDTHCRAQPVSTSATSGCSRANCDHRSVRKRRYGATAAPR